MKRSTGGYFYIVLCALIFSTMEIMLKTVHGVFAPMQITALRFLVGGVLLIPFAAHTLRKKDERLRRRDLGFFLLTGFLCVVLSMVIYQMAVTHTKASVVAVIFSCNPIFVTVLAALLLHEEIRRNHILALILEVLAIVIIVNPLHTQLDPLGVLLAILSALLFSFYSVVGKRASARLGGIVVTCCTFLCGAMELIALLLLGRGPLADPFRTAGLDIFVNVPLFSGIPASALPSLFYICAINSAAGFVCHMLAMEKTSAREASLIFFLKPMLAPVLALIFLHESIPVNMLVGIACFLIGSGVAILPGFVAARRQSAET